MKSKKAEHILDNSWTGEKLTVWKNYAVKAVEIAEQEAEERHEKQMQELKDAFDIDKYHMENNHQIELDELRNRAIETFREICPIGHPSRAKNVGLKYYAVCPNIQVIGFPCCNNVECPFISELTQKLTEKQ